MEGATEKAYSVRVLQQTKSWRVSGGAGRNEAGAGVLRVEKENRAKEGEADAFFAGM